MLAYANTQNQKGGPHKHRNARKGTGMHTNALAGTTEDNAKHATHTHTHAFNFNAVFDMSVCAACTGHAQHPHAPLACKQPHEQTSKHTRNPSKRSNMPASKQAGKKSKATKHATTT